MIARVAAGEGGAGAGERALEPGAEVAAVGERPAVDDAALVEAVEEEARPGLRPLGLVEEPERPRGADHERTTRAGAAGAEVRAGAVDQRREPRAAALVREPRQAFLRDAGRLQQLRVPTAGGEIEEPGSGREREALGLRLAE